MQNILLRENKIDRSKEHFWVVCLSNSKQDTAHRAGQSRHHDAEPGAPERGVQLRAPETGNAVDHGPQPSGRNNEALGCRYRDNRPHVPGGPVLKLPVIDHLIITEREYYSFKNSGLLAELAKSEK